MSQGKKFRELVQHYSPLQIPGTINAYFATLAKKIGHKAIYLSGGGVACSSLGLPDLGITTLEDVLIDTKRITAVCDLPLLVDIDTGWGGSLNIARAIKEMIRAGSAAVHIEDQVLQKRCGHRPNKEITTTQEMCDRIKSAVDARTDENFVIMARTDAFAIEGLEPSIERAIAFKEAGADMIFPEALTELKQYQRFSQSVGLPILANITENGKTPIFTAEELKSVQVSMILYPLTTFRAMSKTAYQVYEKLIKEGSQKNFMHQFHTRQEIYDFIDYMDFEKKLDELFQKEKILK